MPAALMYTLKDPRYNWCYYTTPQKHMNNRNCYWPRARVWGGCSNHNAMVYIRGNALDYDNWEKLGATGWSYAHCLPYFKKSETYELGESEYRGGNGPTGITRGKQEHNPLFKAFVDAGIQAGYPYTDDVNGYQQEGFGSFDFSIWKGKRSSASRSYLRPAESRANLHISSNVLATRILFEGKRAVGVEYEQNKELVRTRARKEVIVSAGAINTPQLLLLSGVGDGDQLKSMDIDVEHHLPGVGQNLQVQYHHIHLLSSSKTSPLGLVASPGEDCCTVNVLFQDHLEVYVQYKCKEPITLYKYQWKFPLTMIKTGVEWFLTHGGEQCL